MLPICLPGNRTTWKNYLEKTEFILLLRKRQLTDISVKDLSVGDSSVERSLLVRKLSFLFDENFTMQKQISAVCKTAYFHLRNIARIRKYLSESAAQSLVHAFVSSRIDYCNSLLSGLPKNLLTKLQYVQNSAASIVKVGYKRNVNAVSVGSQRRGSKQLGCTYGEMFNLF